MLAILGGRVHDLERQRERRAWCPHCNRVTVQYRSPSGLWFCHECGRGQER